MKTRIIVDSTSDLLPYIKEQVHVVPLTVHFGEEEYVDGVTIDHKAFYEKLVETDTHPSTSQASPAAFEQEYEKACQAGEAAVVIALTSKLSGTYQSATIAADEFSGKVFVADSRTAALGSGVLTEYALELADAGMGAEEILQKLIEKRKQVRLYAIVDTLEYLKKGGRLSSAVAVVGGMLNIKPVICVDENGEIKVAGTARGMKKAYAMLDQLCAENGGVDTAKPVLMGYTGTSSENLSRYLAESGQEWSADVKSTIVGAAIGVHAGPGAVAAAFFSKE